MTSFALSKWYLDCVAPGGDAIIVYAAELSWEGLAVRYASVLEHREGETRVVTSLRRCEPPVLRGEEIAWASAPLAARGTWRALTAPIVRPLAEGIAWHCLQPASEARVEIDGRALAGLGYAEHISITVPPWKLPIKELHWGRFLAPVDEKGQGDAVVWIDWRGPQDVRCAFHNGTEVALARASAERVAFDGVTLELDRAAVLREGAIGRTVLSAMPRLVKKLPMRILGVEERKWRSRGVLTRADGTRREGWAIHEVVTWP